MRIPDILEQFQHLPLLQNSLWDILSEVQRDVGMENTWHIYTGVSALLYVCQLVHKCSTDGPQRTLARPLTICPQSDIPRAVSNRKFARVKVGSVLLRLFSKAISILEQPNFNSKEQWGQYGGVELCLRVYQVLVYI